MSRSRSSLSRSSVVHILVIAALAAVIAYMYFFRVDRPHVALRMELHQQIVEGSAPSPYQYRILVPTAAEVISSSLRKFTSPERAFLIAYGAYNLTAVFFFLVVLFTYLKRSFSLDRAFLGLLLVVSFLPIAFYSHYYQPWSFLEAGLFTLSLLLIESRRYWAVLAVTAVATLNRETGIFIPMALLVTAADWRRGFRIPKRDVARFFGGIAVWGVVYVGLRVLLGYAPHVRDAAERLTQNLEFENVLRLVVSVTLAFGAIAVLACLGFRRAPTFAKRTVWIAPLYILAAIVWGKWYEVRMLMPLYAVLAPLAVSFFRGSGGREASSDTDVRLPSDSGKNRRRA